MNIHPDITADAILDAVQRHMTTLDNPGFCTSCGEEVDGIDPDARGDECECCGAPAVYGAEELLMMGAGS
jgi:predicted amidophosphoribosyltransferase